MSADVDADRAVSASANRRVVILTSGPLTDGAAGLANSVISRATAMSEHGWDVTILVDAWQPDLQAHVSRLRRSARLDPRVDVRGVHEDVAAHAPNLGGDRDIPVSAPRVEDHAAGLTARDDPESPRVVRFFAGETYVYFGYRDSDGRIAFLDELVAGKRTRRLFFTPHGVLARTLEYDSSAVIRREEFHGVNGVVHAFTTYPGGGAPPRTTVLDEDGGYGRLPQDESLVSTWLARHSGMRPGDVLISEYAFRFDALQAVKDRLGIAIVYTLHNSHLAAPFDAAAPLKSELTETFRRAAAMDAIVVLTPHQQADIMKRFPQLDNVHVIPHAAPRIPTRSPGAPVEREHGLIVLVGRLAAEKNQAAVLAGFSRVLTRHPSARLELWGRGPDEAALAEQIDSLGLGDHVSLRGFVTDPTAIYERAEMVLLPSLHEGQPLVLMEAMQQGCVPVCFDFKYGARMLVSDLSDGVLVERGAMDDLLDSAAWLLGDQQRRAEMSARARLKMEQFSAATMVAGWDRLIREVTGDDGREGRS